jgi:hypothetical protein
MNHYKYFNFHNFVAINVDDDFFVGGAMGFWVQAKVLERRMTCLNGLVTGYVYPRSEDELDALIDELNPSAFEKTMEELLPLMEEGLIVIGKSGDFHGPKTSYGYAAVQQPAGTFYDAVVAARAEFQKNQKVNSDFEWSWMIQATTKGWEWAKDRKKLIDFAVYNEEDRHFYSSALPNLSD